MFRWFRRAHAGEGRVGSGSQTKDPGSEYWEQTERAIVAALTGDQREEYLAALTELSETMTELGIKEFRECTRSFGGPVVLTPMEIRQRTIRLRTSANYATPQ